MKIKIESGGLSDNTTITNAETGEEIEGVACVTWRCEAGSLATVWLRLTQVMHEPVKLVGELHETQIGGRLFREVKE